MAHGPVEGMKAKRNGSSNYGKEEMDYCGEDVGVYRNTPENSAHIQYVYFFDNVKCVSDFLL